MASVTALALVCAAAFVPHTAAAFSSAKVQFFGYANCTAPVFDPIIVKDECQDISQIANAILDFNVSDYVHVSALYHFQQGPTGATAEIFFTAENCTGTPDITLVGSFELEHCNVANGTAHLGPIDIPYAFSVEVLQLMSGAASASVTAATAFLLLLAAALLA